MSVKLAVSRKVEIDSFMDKIKIKGVENMFSLSNVIRLALVAAVIFFAFYILHGSEKNESAQDEEAKK